MRFFCLKSKEESGMVFHGFYPLQPARQVVVKLQCRDINSVLKLTSSKDLTFNSHRSRWQMCRLLDQCTIFWTSWRLENRVSLKASSFNNLRLECVKGSNLERTRFKTEKRMSNGYFTNGQMSKAKTVPFHLNVLCLMKWCNGDVCINQNLERWCFGLWLSSSSRLLF